MYSFYFLYFLCFWFFDKGLSTYYVSRRRGGRGSGKCWRLLTRRSVREKLDKMGLKVPKMCIKQTSWANFVSYMLVCPKQLKGLLMSHKKCVLFSLKCIDRGGSANCWRFLTRGDLKTPEIGWHNMWTALNNKSYCCETMALGWVKIEKVGCHFRMTNPSS